MSVAERAGIASTASQRQVGLDLRYGYTGKIPRGIDLRITGSRTPPTTTKTTTKQRGVILRWAVTLVHEREYTAFISLSCYQNFSTPGASQAQGYYIDDDGDEEYISSTIVGLQRIKGPFKIKGPVYTHHMPPHC